MSYPNTDGAEGTRAALMASNPARHSHQPADMPHDHPHTHGEDGLPVPLDEHAANEAEGSDES